MYEKNCVVKTGDVMIKLIVFDIDGVITDGSIIVDKNGNEQKRIDLKDIDAIYELHRRGYKIAAITGENTDIVDYFEKRFPWDFFYSGIKTKMETLKQIVIESKIDIDSICYVGDGKYDVDSLKYVKLGICPHNAIDIAKSAADIILQNSGGDGCIWEIINILDNYNSPDCSQNYFYQRLDEHVNMFKYMASDEKLIHMVMKSCDRIIQILDNKGQIFLCGNGGSAADAQHIATEFVSRFYKERPGLNAEALTTNTSTLTAVGNDYSFERIFVRQLEAKAHSGDMLIGISTSGKSKNVIEALRFAKNNGISTVLMTGNEDISNVSDVVDYIIEIPSGITPRVQEAHIFIGHVMAEYVESKMFGNS